MTPQSTPQKIPYIVIGVIAVSGIVFGLFALTLQKDFWTFAAFIVVVIAALFLGLAAYRFFINSWLRFADMKVKQAGEQHQHERLMFELKHKYSPQQQIAAPQAQPAIDGKYTDPARPIAIRLLTETIESNKTNKDGSRKYGASGTQIITQADASELGIIADDWSSGVEYLRSNYDVLTIDGKGTFTTKNKTISRVMADTAVMTIPGRTR